MNTATEKIETLMITTMETARIEDNNENAWKIRYNNKKNNGDHNGDSRDKNRV